MFTRLDHPSQNFPVDRHIELGHWLSCRQANPMFSPSRQTLCAPTHGLPPEQFVVRSQHSVAFWPPLQVPSVASVLQTGVARHVPPAQSQGRPSTVPPSQTPCAITHTPADAQSASVLHACPSRGPAEHRNLSVGVVEGISARALRHAATPSSRPNVMDTAHRGNNLAGSVPSRYDIESSFVVGT